jgi:hypothetical protein
MREGSKYRRNQVHKGENSELGGWLSLNEAEERDNKNEYCTETDEPLQRDVSCTSQALGRGVQLAWVP